MEKKYIIELEDEPFIQHFKNGAWETIYRVKGFNSLVFDWNGLQMLTPYTEPDLEQVKADWYKAGREAEKVRQPDLEQVREEAYEKGYENGFIAGHLKAEKSGQSFYEDGYKRGLTDAWEAARTLWNTAKRKEIFGYTVFSTALMTLTGQEAIEKIRQYEQEQEEQIQVGDEVIVRDKTAVVTEITDRYVRIMFSGGNSYALFSKGVVKTGRHFPEITEVLQKMKESDNG